jgi:hypothetical protein
VQRLVLVIGAAIADLHSGNRASPARTNQSASMLRSRVLSTVDSSEEKHNRVEQLDRLSATRLLGIAEIATATNWPTSWQVLQFRLEELEGHYL